MNTVAQRGLWPQPKRLTAEAAEKNRGGFGSAGSQLHKGVAPSELGKVIKLHLSAKSDAMNTFIQRHRDNVIGQLSGFDRVLFRGTLRSISYADGLGRYMNSQKILLKDFDGWAKRCTQRLKQHIEAVAKKAGRSVHYLASSAIDKEQYARKIADADRIGRGLVCVLSCVEPCFSPSIHRNAQTRRLELRFAPRKCKFYYIYLIDPRFGWMHIRIQSWLPFDVQVYVNGRSYLKQQLDGAGIGYVQHDNSFSRIDNLTRAQVLLDRMIKLNWPRVLSRLLSDWLPALQEGLLPEGTGRYYWTIRQSEVATDVMFREAHSLAAIYPRLCRHAIEGLSCPDILKFMGKSPSRYSGEVTSNHQRLVQGVRVKHTHAGNSIKMYDKGGSVLRIETTINFPGKLRVYRGPLDRPKHNPQWRSMSKSVADIARRVELCRAANERYLEAMAVIGQERPAAAVLDPVSRPINRQAKPARALRPIGPDDAALFAAVMAGDHLIDGLTNGDLQQALFEQATDDANEKRRRSNAIGRKLRLLRRHGLIRKVSSRRLYRVTDQGRQVMGLALAIRQSVTMLSKTG